MFSRQNGQTLLELVAAMAVAIIVVVALTFATIASLRNSQFAKNQSQATKLAQEGIEIVRSARDRNQTIIYADGFGTVTSWNGSGNNTCTDSISIWSHQINGNCETSAGDLCYFTIDNQGVLHYLSSSATFPDNAESIPPPPEQAQFSRAVILTDDPSSYCQRKTVTVVVRWTDFAGDHE